MSSSFLQNKVLSQNMHQVVFSYLNPLDQLKFSCISKSNRNAFCALNSIEVSELAAFLKQLHIYLDLYSIDNKTNLQYCNEFMATSLVQIKALSSQLSSNTKVKAIAFTINSFTSASCKRYSLKAQSETELKEHIEIIKLLNNRHMFKYIINTDITVHEAMMRELFSLIKNYTPRNYFSDFTEKIIQEKKEEYDFEYVDIDAIPIETVIEYSMKYPNRIKRIKTDDIDKSRELLKQVVMLNKDSIITLPNPFFEDYIGCNHITEVNFMSITDNLTFPNEFNYSKIERINTIAGDSESEFNLEAVLTLLHKMPNLKHLSFSTFSTFNNDDFNDFFNRLNAPLLRKIEADLYGFEDDYDFSFLVDRFPHLTHLRLEEHESMSFSYSIKKIFNCEKTQISMDALEKMINNYLRKKHHSLVVNFTSPYIQPFLDHFQEKKEIMNRISASTLDADGGVRLSYAKTAHFNDCYVKPMVDLVDYVIIQYESIPQEVIDEVIKMKPVVINVINASMKKLSDIPWVEGIESVKFVKINNEVRYLRKGNKTLLGL